MSSFMLRFLRSPYQIRLQIFVMLTILSYILLAINAGWGWFGILMQPDFYPAFAFTWIVGYIITVYINFIHRITTKPPKRFFLRKRRLHNQILLGILIPIVFELVMACLYFEVKTGGIENSTFFNIDFILIVAYIVALNTFHMYSNWSKRAALKKEYRFDGAFRANMREVRRLKNILRIKLMHEAPVSLAGVNLLELGIKPKQVACGFRMDNKLTVIYFDGSQKTYSKPLSHITIKLKPDEYFKINPSCFYHRLLIFNYTDGESSRRIRIILRHPFNHLNEDIQRIVSQGKNKAFKQWFSTD